MHVRSIRSVIAALCLAAVTSAGWAQDISGEALDQMAAIADAKANLTATQRKIDTGLLFGIYKATSDARVASFTNAIQPLSATDAMQPSIKNNGTTADATSSVTVTIVAPVSDDLVNAVNAANGKVIYASSNFGRVTAALPVGAIESIAARDDVSRIKLPAQPLSHVGSLTTQGYISHQANAVVSSGVTGAGVKVGVLSDSAYPARVSSLIASGDLPADTVVLPGQAGPTDGSGEDEGTAMMEIVYDMAPGAKLYFATAFLSEESFADNILALAAAGCKVIVDDVSYFDEAAFQDGIVAQAVNTVTASGVIYFSSAANSGSLTKGTSGTWEGDFVDGGASASPVGAGRLHSFGATNYNVLTASTTFIGLHWSDPLGASANDYDLYVLNAAGTSVTAFSNDTQAGTGDPFEGVFRSAGFAVNSRIVILKKASAAPRALHLDTERGRLSIATSGATFGHNAGLNTVSMAATYWNSAKTGVRAFTGAANTNETFSSDGPRKIFFNPNGTAITPGNFLFATNGGTTLQKPDLAAADGVVTKTGGAFFSPFFGTSAAAPHAAGIAALVRSARPDYTVAQTKTAMTATALDSMAAGVDRDSGYGIVMANKAVTYAQTH